MAKTLESAQDNVLNQFRMNKNAKNDFINSQIERSAKLKREFEKSKKNKEQRDLSGYTPSDIKKFEEAEKQAQIDEMNEIIKTKKNNYEHAFMNDFYNYFGQKNFYNQVDVFDDWVDEITIYETSKSKVVVTKGRANKNSFSLNILVEYEKEYFAKGEDFETTKQVVKLTRIDNETFKVTAKYGNLMEMKRSLSSQLMEIINKTKLDNSNGNELSKYKKSWEF